MLFFDLSQKRSGERVRCILEFPHRNRPETEDKVPLKIHIGIRRLKQTSSSLLYSRSIGLKRSDVIDLTSSFIKFINVEFCGAIFCCILFMSENSETSWKTLSETKLTKLSY